MFRDTSCHSLQSSRLNMFKVAIVAIVNSSVLQLLFTPRVMMTQI